MSDTPTAADVEMADTILDAFEEACLTRHTATTVWENGMWVIVSPAGGKWTALELGGGFNGWHFTEVAHDTPVQVFSPLPYNGGHGPSPDYVTTSDFGYFVNYGLMEAWLSHDHDDPNADSNMARPVTREDVRELREHFLDVLETVVKVLWTGDYSPGDGELDTSDGTFLTIGNEDENGEEETHLRWYARLDKDALMIELDVTGSDGTAFWLDYRALNDRKNVLKVLREAEVTVGNEVWADLVAMEDAEPEVVFGEPEVE